MKKSILIVEASSIIRAVVGFLLESEGYLVETATNGVEGLEKIHSNPYHLALISGDLPKIHGYELIREIRKIEPYKDLPILLLTKGERVDREERPQPDRWLYLSELVEPQHLVRQACKILDGE